MILRGPATLFPLVTRQPYYWILFTHQPFATLIIQICQVLEIALNKCFVSFLVQVCAAEIAHEHPTSCCVRWDDVAKEEGWKFLAISDMR